MITYKLVSKKWKSFILDSLEVNRPEKYILSYELNKKTDCTKNSIGIMCFKQFIDALNFFYYGSCQSKGIILKAEGIKQKPLNNLCPMIDRIENFYNGKNYEIYRSTFFPKNTICFESIIPLKILKEF